MPLVHAVEEKNGLQWCLWELAEPLSFFQNEVKLDLVEQKLFDALHLESRKKEFLAARFLWQKQFDGKQAFLYNDIGKPICADCSISVSHSGKMLGFAKSFKQNLGLDIQFETDKILRIKEKFLGRNELEIFDGSINTLTTLWTCKEAIYKCFGDKGVQWNRDIEIVNLELESAIAKYNRIGKTLTVEISLKRISDLHIAFASL